MALTERQRELDEVKWLKSEVMGFDACGSFDYCANCDKSQENPCDIAYTTFNKPACKTTSTKKASTSKATTTKKTTTKKCASTKKTTTKKTASKTNKK